MVGEKFDVVFDGFFVFCLKIVCDEKFEGVVFYCVLFRLWY